MANNLVSHNLRERTPGVAELHGNLEGIGAGEFINASAGNFHLAVGAEAIAAGVPLEPGVCDEDIDGDPRANPPDVGADERLE